MPAGSLRSFAAPAKRKKCKKKRKHRSAEVAAKKRQKCKKQKRKHQRRYPD